MGMKVINQPTSAENLKQNFNDTTLKSCLDRVLTMIYREFQRFPLILREKGARPGLRIRLPRFWPMRINIYVDALNLYFGALKGTPYKWLNLKEMCGNLVRGGTIQRIRYFTAIVQARPHDPDAPTRQQVYIRALNTLPEVSIHLGRFLTKPVSMPLVASKKIPPERVFVYKTEEKGSDVNLACNLVWDAVQKDFDLAVVVSNDSDLLEPIKIVRKQLEFPVGLINPQKKASRVLVPHATFQKQIRPGLLAKCQFPNQLQDSNGVFHKPPSWQCLRIKFFFPQET